jgi:hypothetical protein
VCTTSTWHRWCWFCDCCCWCVCVCVCVCVCESVCECMCVCVRAIAYTPVRRECLQARLLLPVNIEDGRNMQSMWVCHLRVWLWSLCKFKCMCERDKG